ncbi:MAG: BMP family ABC transporter substrate-binding protein [Chloroflexota bacterium]
MTGRGRTHRAPWNSALRDQFGSPPQHEEEQTLRTSTRLVALLGAASFVFAACGGGGATTAPTTAPTEAPPASVEPTPEPTPEATPLAFKACEVSDTGGIDDKGFNQNAWEGVQLATEEFNLSEPKFLESAAQTDYAKNIQTFIDEGCDIIVTVGFLLGDDTKIAAEANTDQKFAIVDYAYDPTIPNVLGIVFAMDEPSFMAGYLAAGMSKTGAVGTFGGINIPPVAVFMDGFVAGVNYYNKQKGTSVRALGWDPVAQQGSFTGDFSDTAKGNAQAAAFIQEGADVIFAVAGPVGLGAMAAVQDANAGGADVKFIGVDVDQFVSAPEYEDIMLSSVLKRIDNGVKAAIGAAVDGSFAGGVLANNLANEGTGLAEFHNFDSAVPAELKAELDAIKAGIIDGSIVVKDYFAAG